jgi:hypothetical protein
MLHRIIVRIDSQDSSKGIFVCVVLLALFVYWLNH